MKEEVKTVDVGDDRNGELVSKIQSGELKTNDIVTCNGDKYRLQVFHWRDEHGEARIGTGLHSDWWKEREES